MTHELTYCAKCDAEIPKRRLEAMPDTMVCVKCSEEIGGEHELQVTISSTGKAGSLKKTGVEVQVKLRKKEFR